MFSRSQCSEPGALQFRSDCNNKFKFLLRQCLNETESLAFDKIEDIGLRIYGAMCGMDQDRMKSKY